MKRKNDGEDLKGKGKEKLRKFDDTTTSSEQTHKVDEAQPTYVLNIPFVVDSDSDVSSDESSSSDDDSDSFNDEEEHYFGFESDNPPFRVKSTQKGKYRGEISERPITKASESNQNHTTANSDKKLNQLVNIIEQQSFGKTKDDSIKEIDRLAVVIGFNRRESLDEKRNRGLERAMHESLPKTTTSVAKMGFFWRPIYEEKQPGKENYEQVKEYQRVKKWFKLLKKKDSEKAKKFRIEQEKEDIGKMVPYREIREEIKNSVETENKIAELRQKYDSEKQYLGIFDADLQGLRKPGDVGTFSHYDRMIQEHIIENDRLPHVLSSGYRIESEQNRLLELAVTLDLMVRAATAKILGYGVYYPEPNLLLLILRIQKTITESFKGKPNTSPVESKRIIEKMINERKLDLYKDFRFDPKGAIVTLAPPRFEKMKQQTQDKKKIDKVFIGRYNQDNEIIGWTKRDILRLEDTSQSHVQVRQWSESIVDNLLLAQSHQTNALLKGSRCTLISILSSLFNCYNPIKIAKEKSETQKKSFVSVFIEILDNYFTEIPGFSEGVVANSKKKFPNEPLQNVNDLETLLGKLLKNSNRAKKIHEAAKAAGKILQATLTQHLCLDFIELTIDHINMYFARMNVGKKIFTIKSYPKVHQHVFDNTLLGPIAIENQKKQGKDLRRLDSKNIKKGYLEQIEEINKAEEINKIGPFKLTPIHIAIITGNVAAVEYLKEEQVSITTCAANKVTALHLAVLYSSIHGDCPELVRAVAHPDTVFIKADDGNTPFAMALHELEEPLPIIKVMLDASKILLVEFCEDLYLFVNWYIKNSQENLLLSDLIEFWFNDVVNINSDDLIKKDERYAENFLKYMLKLIGFPQQHVATLINSLKKNQYEISCSGAFLISVIKDCAGDPEFMKALMQAGVDINAADPVDENFPLHESIAPLHTGKSNQVAFDWLLKNKVDIEMTDGAGNTPLAVALDAGNARAVKELIKAGLDVSELDESSTRAIRELIELKVYNEDEQDRRRQIKQENAAFSLLKPLQKSGAAEGLTGEDVMDFMDDMDISSSDISDAESDDESSRHSFSH